MEICRHSTPADFLERAQPWLQLAEAENNLALGIAQRLCRRSDADPDATYWATIESGHSVVGCAFRTPPHNLGLTRMPPTAAQPLAADVRRLYGSLPGISGPRDDAMRFADAWRALAGTPWRVHLNLRIHRLSRVAAIDEVAPGRLRRGTEQDLGIAVEWMSGFVDDVHATHIPPELGEQMLRAGQLYFWDDGEPRAMVGSSRETPHGACISAVYTPRALRGRGYATAAVAAISQAYLDAGKRFCCLYTDLANPTTNSIYRRIGYRPVQDAIDIEFE